MAGLETRSLHSNMGLATADEQVSNEGSYLQPISTIEKEQNKIITSNVERLELVDLHNLMFIWKGPTLISFQNLELLVVVGCSKLNSIFSNAIITSLPQLKYLWIEDCEELEELVSSSAQGGECHCGISAESRSQQVCFPKLTYVRVRSCNKMKILFTLSMAEHLQRLESLEIMGASQLEHVFSCGRETHDHHGNDVEIMLPSLKVLSMHLVPNLNYIACGGLQFQLHFPALEEEYHLHLTPPSNTHNLGDGYDAQ